MTNEIVKAGHRYYGLGYLILAEDGADPANDDPDLPENVLRATILGGRQIDLVGPPADEFRDHLWDRQPPRGYAQGHPVPPPSPRRTTDVPTRRRRKAE